MLRVVVAELAPFFKESERGPFEGKVCGLVCRWFGGEVCTEFEWDVPALSTAARPLVILKLLWLEQTSEYNRLMFGSELTEMLNLFWNQTDFVVCTPNVKSPKVRERVLV